MVSAEILKGFQLFEGLDESELVEVAKLCRERSYEEGSIIHSSGGSVANIYLLKEGEVNVQVELVFYDLEERINLCTLRKGDIVGWSALVPPQKSTATAKCQRKSEVITINGKELMHTFEKNNHIGYIVMANLNKVISSRLAATMVALRHQIQKAAAIKV